MTQLAAPAAISPDKPAISDVWSRTAPKYRRRAIIMLALLFVLFAGLCCFTYWLRTGEFWPPGSDAYADIMARSFRPTGANQITLSDFLSAPISVKEVPIHGMIMGLLFATLGSIPLLVSILYRFPSAILLAAMVVFLAAMPWFGFTILGGCILASLPRFRFHFRYASALLGLVPIGIYFIMASWEPAGTRPRSGQNLALLYAPWVLALLSSCVICAVALAIAKVINYRPGGITPVLAILFVIPVVLFNTKVGRDELEYRLLEREIGPGGGALFHSVDVGALADREATRVWSETHEPSYDAIKRPILSRLLEEQFVDTENDKERAIAECDSFKERLPKSPYVPNVLFLKGQALDQRINVAKLLGQHRAEYRCDVPSVRSQITWQTLDEQFPRHELTAVALYKLAYQQARQAHFEESVALLGKLAARFDVSRAPARPAAAATDASLIFKKPAVVDTLQFDLDLLLRQGRRMGEMIRACRNDGAKPHNEVFGPGSSRLGAAVHPLSLLLSLDETDSSYETNLQGTVYHFAESTTAGYAQLWLLMQEPALSRRISRLRAAAAKMAKQPSGAEAMFLLADVLQEDSVIDEARDVFTELARAYPESCWAVEAKDRLASLTLAEPGPR